MSKMRFGVFSPPVLCLISSPKGLAAFCLLPDKDSSFLKSSLYLYPGPRIHFSCIPVLVFIYEYFFRTCLRFMNVLFLFCAGGRKRPASRLSCCPGSGSPCPRRTPCPCPLALPCVLPHGVCFAALRACLPSHLGAPSLCVCWFTSAVGLLSSEHCHTLLFKAVCGWRGATAGSLVGTSGCWSGLRLLYQCSV